MNNVIKVEGLKKKYGNITAADNITFFVEEGTIVGLLGANGAGKSTAIECILGTKTCDHGKISILGMNPKTDRKQLFEKVGVQFQEANYPEKIRVFELCCQRASLYKNPSDWYELLNQFNIGDKTKNFVSNLSGGERQRLFIVLALIPNPEVVFLDELTTGLDAKARREVWKTLSVFKKRGLTILLTSHFMDEVEILCDKICILKKGKIVFQGTVAEAVKNSPYEKFEDTYLWYTEEEENKNENFFYNV